LYRHDYVSVSVCVCVCVGVCVCLSLCLSAWSLGQRVRVVRFFLGLECFRFSPFRVSWRGGARLYLNPRWAQKCACDRLHSVELLASGGRSSEADFRNYIHIELVF
jgi:hypothetical protein